MTQSTATETATTTATTTTQPSTQTISSRRQPKIHHRTRDPFFDLPLPSPPSRSKNPSPLSSPNGSSLSFTSTVSHDEPSENDSLLYRLVMTPLLFTSFLISLFLINRRDLSRRALAHGQQSTTPSTTSKVLSYLSPTSWLRTVEPYQHPSDSTWGHTQSSVSLRTSPGRGATGDEAGGTDAGPHMKSPPSPTAKGDKSSKRTDSWYYKKKHRKMARLEVGDALEMRTTIMVLMVGIMIISLGLMVLCLRKAWSWLFY